MPKSTRVSKAVRTLPSAVQDWLDGALPEDSQALRADGFDSGIIGVCYRAGTSVLVYDYAKCTELLVTRDGMSHEEALEYMEFNVVGAYVGEGTPIFVQVRR